MTKRLKLTLMLCTLWFPANHAENKVNPLMKCLGMEELAIHKKKVYGPITKLNQHFVNELATLYGITLTDEAMERVCRQGTFSPSVNFLQELLIYGKKSFYIPPAAKQGGVEALATSSLEGFLDSIPHVFFDYISQLQSLAPLAPCLENEIPEIKFFMEQYKYLEEITGSIKIIKQEEAKVLSIFEKLKKLDQIIQKCEEIKKKKS